MPEVRFTYNETEYAYDVEKITTLEAIELKKMSGFTVKSWMPALENADPEAYRVFVWLALKKAGATPECKYSEFDFPLVEVMTSFDVDVDEEPDPTPARTSKPRSRRSGH